MQSMRVLGWVSMLVAFAILGMGGAPIAEMFELHWLVTILKWVSYISVGLLVIATLVVGGLGMYHGVLTVLGKDIGTYSGKPKPKPQPLPGTPVVEASPARKVADATDSSGS